MSDSDKYLAYDKTLDGRTVSIRAIRPTDKCYLQDLFLHLGNLSRYYRFLGAKRELTSTDLGYFTELDFVKHIGLIAFIVENGVRMTAGVGRYVIIEDAPEGPVAEFALAVEDQYQGLGIGTLLLRHLIHLARTKGVAKFVALAFRENKKMLDVAEHLNIPVEEHFDKYGVVQLAMNIGKYVQQPGDLEQICVKPLKPQAS